MLQNARFRGVPPKKGSKRYIELGPILGKKMAEILENVVFRDM